MAEGPVLLNVGRRPKPVMRDGQVEDQAPDSSGIAQILSDLHVAAAVACTGRHLMLSADGVTSPSGDLIPTIRGSGAQGGVKLALYKSGALSIVCPEATSCIVSLAAGAKEDSKDVAAVSGVASGGVREGRCS